MPIVVKYKKGDEESVMKQYKDYRLIEVRNTIEGDFLVFEDERETIERQMAELKDQIIEKLILDEDVTDLKKKYKDLKQKLLAMK